MKKECEFISEVIYNLDHNFKHEFVIDGKKIKRDTELVKAGDYEIRINNYAYIVWKGSDEPRYKGSQLFKVVPRMELEKDKIINILSNEYWAYP